MKLIKKIFSGIRKKGSGNLLKCTDGHQVRLTNNEIVFLHYALSLVKKSSIDHLNALSEFKTSKYIVEEYCWEMIQESDKLLNVLDQEIRKRKLQKTYLEYKMESHVHFKTEEKHSSGNKFNSFL